ncbi:MAG: zf-HC2 domain-containing protein [Acidobacteriota bacterium]|nr:zf-HC2 domain-containing protein [Acidobacteriota bacterium]
MSCTEIAKTDTLEKYLLGELDEEGAGAFEEHYFACAECSDAVQDAAALISELADERWAVRDKRWPEWTSQWVFLAAAAVLVLAIGASFWLWSPGPSASSTAVLAELSVIEAPPYEPKTLRGGSGGAERGFHEAMAPYLSGDYGATIEGLEDIAAAGPGSIDVSFYLGACYLLTDRPQDAIESLGMVVETGRMPYLEWARFYRAQAFLRLGDREAAKADLEAVLTIRGELEESAKAALDRL